MRGLTQRVANTEEEALNLMFEGEMNRSIAAHQLNAASSRYAAGFVLFCGFFHVVDIAPELQSASCVSCFIVPVG